MKVKSDKIEAKVDVSRYVTCHVTCHVMSRPHSEIFNDFRFPIVFKFPYLYSETLWFISDFSIQILLNVSESEGAESKKWQTKFYTLLMSHYFSYSKYFGFQMPINWIRLPEYSALNGLIRFWII